MLSRRNVFTVALAALVGGAAPALAATIFDTDSDGTVDLDEAKKAANALFDILDTDKDGTLDLKELKGRLTQEEFAAADPDNDGTLSKDEYLAVVEKRFKAADPDNDVLAAVTTVAAAGDASLASAPCASVARSMSLAWSGEATRTALPPITSSLGGAVTCGASFEMFSLDAGLVEARFFAG